MSHDINLTVDKDPLSINIMDSANVIRFWVRIGPGDSNLFLSKPIPRENLVKLKEFLDFYLDVDDN